MVYAMQIKTKKCGDVKLNTRRMKILLILIVCLCLSIPVYSSSLLKVGSMGEEVREIQRVLYSIKLIEDSPDGIFGSRTREAVMELQRILGLAVDGMVGEETRDALMRANGEVTPLPLLREGEEAPEVLLLQSRLMELGLFRGGITGHYNSTLLEAVRAFQREMGLVVDGVVGEQTWTALMESEIVTTTTEARSILRSGDRGEQVRLLQTKLAELNFYRGPIDGHFGLQTEMGLKQAQRHFGIEADGIAGPATWSAFEQEEKNLQNSYSVQRGDTLWSLARRWDTTIEEIVQLNSLSNSYEIREGESLLVPGSYSARKRAIKDLHWNEVNLLFPVNSTVTLTDVETGLSFRVQRLFGSFHADVEPLTAQDTAILRTIYGGEWSWERRAVIVHLEDTLVAGSINGFPHDSQSIYNNNFNGHICLHFRGSRLHNSGHPDSDHQQEIQMAARQVWPLH